MTDILACRDQGCMNTDDGYKMGRGRCNALSDTTQTFQVVVTRGTRKMFSCRLLLISGLLCAHFGLGCGKSVRDIRSVTGKETESGDDGGSSGWSDAPTVVSNSEGMGNDDGERRSAMKEGEVVDTLSELIEEGAGSSTDDDDDDNQPVNGPVEEEEEGEGPGTEPSETEDVDGDDNDDGSNDDDDNDDDDDDEIDFSDDLEPGIGDIMVNGPVEDIPGNEPEEMEDDSLDEISDESDDNDDDDNDDDDGFNWDLKTDNDDVVNGYEVNGLDVEPVEIEEDSDSEGDDIGDDDDDDDTMVNNYEEEDGTVLKRKKRFTRREWVLSKPDHPAHVTLVTYEEAPRRVKRTSYNITQYSWPHRIPYAYGDFDDKLKYQLEKVLRFLEDRLCVEFFHEQGFDSKNPNWFKEHGYSTNAHIVFQARSSCAAVYGRGSKDNGARKVNPCTQWGNMMHEILHSLGGIHTQNYPYRERYITMHTDNIQKGLANNFKKTDGDSGEVEFEIFDPSSLLMYYKSQFSKNGLTNFDYVRPDMSNLYGPFSYRNIMLEMTKNYKCAELYCKDHDGDCGVGYLGYIKHECACVCPYGFDPASNCKSVINGVDTSIKWPDTPFTLYKADDDCPEGMETGRVPLNVGMYKMNYKKLPSSKGTVYVDMCTKKAGSRDFESWPFGSYCIGKAEGVPCSTPFKEGEVTMTTRGTMNLTGSVGDVTVKGNRVTLKYCCRSAVLYYTVPMKLPTEKPFRLLKNDRECQEVEGMWTLPGYVVLKGKAFKDGAGPSVGITSVYMKQTSCYYQPPTYGCSREVTLDSDNPSTTVSVPVAGGRREANKRCLYYFQAPEGSRLRLTFKKIRLHPKDRVLVKRFSLLENPHKIDLERPPYQTITEKHQLYVEYWSYFESGSRSSGAEFQIDLLPRADMCYDADTNGADYAGTKDVTETYEGCVAWSQATSCPDFPWHGTNGLDLLNSGKSCRNLDTTGMLQPWCYSYVNGTMCQRRYCDVCNDADPVDVLDNCKKYINGDPNFCEDALGRFGCFKSCGMEASPYDQAHVKCAKPVLPDGITSSEELQDSYVVGAKVALSCGEIECTSHGWTPFDDTCTAQCADASQLCENAVTKYPEFCTDPKTKMAADRFCQKTCGGCEPAASCSVPTGAGYSLASGSPSTVSTGQNVQFACHPGLVHVSGDLRRACSVSGALLGDEPVCQVAPVDINMEQIYKKSGKIPSRTAYLMVGEDLAVPFDGKISRWYFYCHNELSVTLLVYRRSGKSNSFELVGSNKASCVPGWPWSHTVATGDQISVRKGDVLGVLDMKKSIAVQSCQSSKEKWAPNVTVKVRKASQLLGKKVTTFKSDVCAFVAIGARVDPV